MCQPTTQQSYSTALAFWLMGALNNVPYTVMIAGAKSISEGGTALVFLADVAPGLFVKLSGPYWFEKVSYQKRIVVGSILMTLSFMLVATFAMLREMNVHEDEKGGLDVFVIMQLLGVACCSIQGSLGEATLLALCGKVDSLHDNDQHSINLSVENHKAIDEYVNDDATHKTQKSWNITAFSSGTGLAGILGFAYVVFFTDILQLQLTMALYAAMIFPILYILIYQRFLHEFTPEYETLNGETVALSCETDLEQSIDQSTLLIDDSNSSEEWEYVSVNYQTYGNHVNTERFRDNYLSKVDSFDLYQNQTANYTDFIKSLTTKERLHLTLSFWPFMIPLFVVYASEYALQSGVWPSIGFPVEDVDARKSCYMKSNWLYQLGVFISRSSGAFFMVPMWVLWLMPFLQIVNLVAFYLIATYHFWCKSTLLIGCFYVGLLGGAVYVNGYMRVNKDLPVSIREFALGTVSIADSLGIVFADYSGLFIQSCLYKSNGINGAVVDCPF